MKIIIVGNGMVGFKLCEKLVAKSTKSLDLIVFGEEMRPAYDRVHLSEFFNGKSAEELQLAPSSWYADKGIELIIGDPILEIDRKAKSVRSYLGRVAYYDYLILATGSAAFVPPIPGIEKAGVFIYRTIEDLVLMQSWAPKAKTGAVIGGGLLGLEAAKAMIDLGVCDTHVIEFAPRLMPRQIDDAGSSLLQGKLESLGLTIHTSKNTQEILGESAISGMQFQDESILPVDMLVISAGIKPRDELARACGLEVGPRGGIVVNQ